jgi:hypothetical protein
MSNATSQAFTIAFTVPSASAKLAELKAFCLTHDIAVTANKSYKASYQQAIESWVAAQMLATEIIEIAQPVAATIEDVAVEYGTIAVEFVTSPEAVSVYRQALLWTVVGVSIALTPVYTIVAGAWILLMALAEEHEVGLKLVRAAAAVYVTAKRSVTLAELGEMITLYQPNAAKAWVVALGWLANLGWVLAQGRQAVFGG